MAVRRGCGQLRRVSAAVQRHQTKGTSDSGQIIGRNSIVICGLTAPLPPLQPDLLRGLLEENSNERTEQKAVACLQRLLLSASPRLSSVFQLRAQEPVQ